MRRLKRDSKNAVLGGVAAGVGRYTDVDPVIIRIAFVVLAFFNGIGVLLYAIGWALMPNDKDQVAGESGAEVVDDAPAGTARTQDGRWIAGIALIVIGALLLIDRLPWFDWPYWMHIETLWPLVVVFIGVGLILKSRRAPAASNGGTP